MNAGGGGSMQGVAMKMAVACGGTGGHIFPGLASAQELRRRGHDVTLWLAGRDVEAGSLHGWEGATVSVASAGFQGGGPLRAAGVVFRLMRAVCQCRRRMGVERPQALLAMGSYASVGPVLAARWLRVPVVLHEANAIPGRAITFLAPFAAAVAVGFPEAAKHFRHPRVVLTGFPVRRDLDGAFAEGELAPGLFNVLVMGGSQGAHRLNEIVPEGLILAHRGGVPVQAIHLAGRADADAVRARYEQAGVPARVFPFLAEMGRAYGAAQFAIARSGAATCAELSRCGLPALLVPLPNSQKDHQAANAASLKAGGGVDVVQQRDLSPEWLADYIGRRYRDPDGIRRMGERVSGAAVPDAVERIAELVETVASGR